MAISNQIAEKLPAAEFAEWLQRWKKHVEKDHIISIAKFVPNMYMPSFLVLDNDFNFFLKSTVKLRKRIDKIISSAGQLFEKFFVATKSKDQRQIMTQVVEKMEEFQEKQKLFENRLNAIESTLAMYNRQRKSWAKYILSSNVVEAAKYQPLTIQFGSFPPLTISKNEE